MKEREQEEEGEVEEEEEKKKKPAQAELFLGWMDICFISCLAPAQQGQLFQKRTHSNISSQNSCCSRRNRRVAANVDKKNSLMYAQLLGSAHVHMLVMCNPNFFLCL